MDREPSSIDVEMSGPRRGRGAAMSRRRFFAAAAAGSLAGCATAGTGSSDGETARIMTRPFPPTTTIVPGEHRLNLGGRRDGLLFVPRTARPDSGVPLLLMLHGAGGSAAGVRFTFASAEEFGVIVLAPDSRGSTWDVIHGRPGPDVAFINTALHHAFERVAIDPRRLGAGGFSDGASYALSIAVPNGDLFTHVVAFSPGFVTAGDRRGKPRIFISHGTQDAVLPIARTSHVIVPDLQSRGYDVRYREFGGPHAVPQSIAREAFQWFTR
jgi:phospholipase/carboxylesterase